MCLMDKSAIFLLIAGTYTSLALSALQGAWGWSVFGVVWGLAVIGILMKVLLYQRRAPFTDLYLTMGWAILNTAKPIV